MVNLSTSFIAGNDIDGLSLVETLRDLPIDGVELEYRISHQVFAQMRLPLKRSCLKVVSIHNYFPIPALKPPVKGGGDLFLLSSPDPEERQRAVNWTFKTIEHANDLEAPVAILHCGRVEFSAELEKLYGFYNNDQIDAPEAQAFIQHKLNARDQVIPNHLDALLFAVDRLIPYAEKQGVTLGLENRYHYHELPTLPVMRRLLAEFKGGPIGYWHDTGHAHANAVLGLVEPGELVRELGTEIVGMHWHDAIGLKDHLVPGEGEIDFSALQPYIKNGLPIVIELKPGTSQDKVLAGIAFTREQILLAAKKLNKPNT